MNAYNFSNQTDKWLVDITKIKIIATLYCYKHNKNMLDTVQFHFIKIHIVPPENSVKRKNNRIQFRVGFNRFKATNPTGCDSHSFVSRQQQILIALLC